MSSSVDCNQKAQLIKMQLLLNLEYTFYLSDPSTILKILVDISIRNKARDLKISVLVQLE